MDTCDFVFVADGLHTCIVQLANGTDFKCKQPAALWSSNQENPNLAATLHAVKRVIRQLNRTRFLLLGVSLPP